MSLPDRVRAIEDRLSAELRLIIKEPELVVVERWAIVRTAGGVLDRWALQWSLMRYLVRHEIPVVEVSSSELKVFATGKAGADKGAIIEAVTRRYPHFETAGNDNACDAIALCAIGCHLMNRPLAEVPKTHSRVLEGLAKQMGG